MSLKIGPSLFTCYSKDDELNIPMILEKHCMIFTQKKNQLKSTFWRDVLANALSGKKKQNPTWADLSKKEKFINYMLQRFNLFHILAQMEMIIFIQHPGENR